MSLSSIPWTSPSEVVPSIILIGYPGAGKRSLGFIGARHLGRRLIIADRYFEIKTGISRVDYLQKYGNGEFQKRTVEVVQCMLQENITNCIIECGLSSLSRSVQQLLHKYQKTHPVIYVSRCKKHVRSYLHLDDRGARLLEDCDTAHRECSNFDYYNLFDPFSRDDSNTTGEQPSRAAFFLKNAKLEISHFLDLVVGSPNKSHEPSDPFAVDPVALECRERSYILSVRLSDLIDERIEKPTLASGEDAILLNVDIQRPDMATLISKYIAIIRRNVRIPIVYTVDRHDTSLIDDVADSGAYFTLLHCGIRNCVEYLMMDITMDQDCIRNLIKAKSRTKVIGCYFDNNPGGHGWLHEARYTRYQEAESLGCDIVQLTQPTMTRIDNEDVQHFTRRISELDGSHPPLIAYNVGSGGRTSQLFNKIMTPVTDGTVMSNDPIHPQITLRQAIQGLFGAFVFDPLNMYLIGYNASVSLIPPAMHRVAYEQCGFAHTYHVFETNSIEDVLRVAQRPNFGGASISLPFKTELLDHLRIVSHHASSIGAVNTLLPLRTYDGEVLPLASQSCQRNQAGPIAGCFGDNTDWLGIQSCIQQNLSPRNAIEPSRSTALIIGAGGGARAAIYGIIQLGCRKIYIFNRTVERAQQVARHFNSLFSYSDHHKGDIVTVLPSLDAPWPAGEDQATIIVSSIPAHTLHENPRPNLTLPESWLQSKSGGVVAELSYLPQSTPLLKQVHRLRDQIGRAWITVDGLEILPLQAIHQFELMTGRKAPREVMMREARRIRSLQDPDSETPNAT